MRRTALVAALAGLLGISFAVSQTVTSSLGAPSDGLKHPPTAALKNFEIETLAQGFDEPTSFDFLPDGTLLVTERDGKLKMVAENGAKSTLLDISSKVATDRERGLGTVEVASDYATSHRVFISYTFLANKNNPGGPQAMHLSYIRLNDDHTLVNPDNPETLVLGKDVKGPCPPVDNNDDCPPSVDATHQAGNVVSDPDGSIWVSYGDSNLPSNPGAQTLRTYNPNSTAGKILHLQLNGDGLPGHAFCKKDDNLSHTCTKVYAMGFRNPYRFSLSNEDNPIVSDVGWNTREEISFVKKGRNYGWPCYEGSIHTPFYKDLHACKRVYRKRKKEKISGPILDYKNPATGAGAAIITGPIYNTGNYPPKFQGTLFYGDYAQGFIKRLVYKKKKHKFVSKPVAFGVTPVDMGYAPDGNLAFTDYRRGSIRELVFAAGNKSPQPVASADPSSGLSPLNVQFSTAGTVDPDGDPMTFEWDFGDGDHGTGPSPTHVYTVDGTYNVTLVVSDNKGGKAVTRLTVTAGNAAPTAAITKPTPTTFTIGGQPTQVAATGSDPEDGPLPDSAFKWTILLHHKDHVHPEGIIDGPTGQFVAVKDHDADSYYTVSLTVTDSQGLSTTLPDVVVHVSVQPIKVTSNLKGVKLSYAGRELKAPQQFRTAIGFAANLSAPAKVKYKGKTYKFDHWTQGGSRVQNYDVPPHPSIVKAIFKRAKG